MIDDGWPACAVFRDDGGCHQAAARDNSGRIQVDVNKFPHGMKWLADQIHGLGLKIGIYTAVSHTTCGGFSASLGFESVDAATFADWDMDFVKHDTCNYDCGVHDGCMQNSTAAMRDGLNATGKPIVYYIDAGNPSSPSRVYNPKNHNVNPQDVIKIASDPSQLVYVWGPSHANMWKSWFDISDNWESTLDNVHHQIGLSMYQSCGAFNTPDMVTIGQGALSDGQYRAQMFIWSVLGAPIILGNDLRQVSSEVVNLLTATEVLAVDQDEECIQGSLSRADGASEIWTRPLSDGTFAVAILNKSSQPQNITIKWAGPYTNGGDMWPAQFLIAKVRDIYAQQDLGLAGETFTSLVPPLDARIFKIAPVN